MTQVNARMTTADRADKGRLLFVCHDKALNQQCIARSGSSHDDDIILLVIAQVARDLWLLVNKPLPRATPLDSGLFTAINPWHLCYNYN